MPDERVTELNADVENSPIAEAQEEERADVQVAKPLHLRVSLFRLYDELADLVDHRLERMADTEDPPTPEELQAVDGEIAKYIEAIPEKVSGTVGIFRYWDSILTALYGPKDRTGARHGGEIDRLRAIAKSTDAKIEYLKSRLAEVLERMPAPKKGSRKLVGSDGSQLILKKNGGLASLDISNALLVPDEFKTISMSMPVIQWRAIVKALPPHLQDVLPTDEYTAIDNAAVREALAKPCPTCLGLPVETPCTSCGGSGCNAVPGARILERGSHIEVK